MDINEPLHGQIHLWMIFSLILLGYLAVAGNKYWARRHEEDIEATGIILGMILLVFCCIFAYLTFFYRTPMEEVHVRLEPFWSYREAFDGMSIRRLGVARSIILNIAIMIPLGYLLPAVYRGTTHRYLWTFLSILILSVITEILQLITKTGLCELDDIMSNSFGAMIGILGYVVADKVLNKQRRMHDETGRRRRVHEQTQGYDSKRSLGGSA